MEEKAKCKTIVVSLYGAPCTRKSTTCAKVFSRLKEEGILEVEMSLEVAKTFVYDGRKVDPYMQFILFGEECRNQSRLFGAVDVACIDSPLGMIGFYNYYYYGSNSLSEPCREFYQKGKKDDVIFLNFFLPLSNKYNPKGRFQSKDQALEISDSMLKWLDSEGYEYEVLDFPSSKERVERILERIKEVREGIRADG